jgi:anaerobic dimethyl sulfoxide reductase subunit A
VLADQFIGIRPCTDTAMLLALAYEMITNDLQDQDFLDKYTVGFDVDHMPEGANLQDNFKDYVLGTYDGTPKTAEWASEICGVEVDVIKSLAYEMATTKPMALTCSRAPARTSHGDQFAQAFLTVGWMTGNVGKYGAMVGHVVTSNVGSGQGGPFLMSAGDTGVEKIPNPVSKYQYYTIDPADTSDWSCINHSEIWDAVLNGEYHAGARGVLPINIQLINHIGRGSTLNQSPATKKGIEAHRKVEFVVASGYHMNTNCRYADIVFPVCTRWEEEGTTLINAKTNRETVLVAEQITEPLFEAKTDAYLDEQLGIRMGIDPAVINPVSLAQQGFNKIAGATMVDEDGVTKIPLFTIEEDDIPEGVDGEPQEGRFTYKQFLADGFVRVPRSEGDNYGYTALKDFIDDPVANPRETPSGKLEIYCQGIADFCKAVGFTEKSPIAKYEIPEEGFEETFDDWDSKTKGDYPFQLVTLHCLRTVHSSFDNVPWCREAAPNDLQINARDAAELGIEDGDTVIITSHWGQCLRNVDVTERIMPGVVKLDEATWVDVDEETGIDKAGSANYLVGDIKSGSGIQAWNSCNVRVEKWDGEALPPDCEWPQRVVEA